MPLGAAQPVADQPGSIDSTIDLLQSAGYVADRSLATVLFSRSSSAPALP
jgi:hypothetical protein